MKSSCGNFIVILGVILILSIFQTTTYGHGDKKIFEKFKQPVINGTDCLSVEGFTQELRDEIASKAKQVNMMIDLVLNGKEKHSTYNELATFCDAFGPRLSGSKSLAAAIDYMSRKMVHESQLVMRNEKVMIPRWEIGQQWAEMVRPVKRPISILALGYSVGTNNETLEAEAVIVNSFDQLDKMGSADLLRGKIVVFNYNFTRYGESVKYRSMGAQQASKYGAAAALIRSVTPFSIYSPHTGAGSKSIPTAAITLEDADMFQRWHNRGKKIVLKVFMDAQNYPDVESVNIVGDIVGSSKPDEVVLVSGHIDSWYNTEGAMDDGGGMMISYKALDLLRKLNLRARRTVRAVLWVSEEFGLIGAQQYIKNHRHELDKFKIVMESDLGTFAPQGLSITNASPLLQCVVGEVLKLTESINTTQLDNNYEGSDIEVFTDLGVPGLSLKNANDKYFMFHHTSGDSITLENPDDLDRTTILWAAASYVLADLSIDLK